MVSVTRCHFFSSGHGPYGSLMEMDGLMLHRWEAPIGEVFPELSLPVDNTNQYFWRRAHLLRCDRRPGAG